MARQRLRRLLSALSPHYMVIAEAANGEEVLDLVSQHSPDIVLLDINMPALDGMQTADKLRQRPHSPVIIFITAYDQYALAAFEQQAVDYLLKPVKQARLQQGLLRAEQLLQSRPQAKTLQIKQANGVQNIPLNDIYYFRAEQKYVIARHSQGEYLLEQSLKQLEQQFKTEFIRVHRNALVSVQKIQAIQKKAGKPVLLFQQIDDTVDISRRHLASIMAQFN